MKKWLFLVGLTALLLHGAQDARAAAVEELFTKVKVTLNLPPADQQFLAEQMAGDFRRIHARHAPEAAPFLD